MVRNIDQHREDAKWLVHTLDDLTAGLSDQEAASEQHRLDPILERYKQLMPAIEITTTRSSIVVRCHDYKDEVENQMEWLNEAEDRVREDVPLDDIESVRAMMEEQQVYVLSKQYFSYPSSCFKFLRDKILGQIKQEVWCLPPGGAGVAAA